MMAIPLPGAPPSPAERAQERATAAVQKKHLKQGLVTFIALSILVCFGATLAGQYVSLNYIAIDITCSITDLAALLIFGAIISLS